MLLKNLLRPTLRSAGKWTKRAGRQGIAPRQTRTDFLCPLAYTILVGVANTIKTPFKQGEQDRKSCACERSASDRSYPDQGMMMFSRLTDAIYVSSQISAGDVAEAGASGIALIINNRPDGESPEQTPGEVIEQEAHRSGLAYVAIPVTHAGIDDGQVRAMADALGSAAGPVLAYCRSGTRSTLLWALAEAMRGADPDGIADTAAAAGYDIAPVRNLADRLYAQSGNTFPDQ